MKFLAKLIVASLCVLPMQLAFAAGNDCGPSCPPKPCSPAPCPKPCPPKPCCPPVCFERGYPNDQCCFPSAYNEPADYELNPCPWDFWFDASFTYWMAYEEGLDLAVSRALIAGARPIADGTFLFQDTEFKPGFKIGLGMDLGHDHWSAFAEYTWFRSRTHTSSAAPEGPAGSSSPTWLYNNWALNQAVADATSISSTWRLRMDLLDAALTRPYYQGTHLIIAPFGGIRAAWIRQNFRISSTPFSTTEATASTSAVFHNKSHSWALGPRGGLQGEWHLGWGFRLEGDCSGSILFTRYTKVATSLDSTTLAGHALAAKYSDYDTLRFNNDMSLGLGWGSYLDCRNYHLDLLATYDFQIFWNQNLMRQLVDDVADGVSTSPNNLYLQGLTVRAQFDF